ncbi:MAG: threonylcarbamoyl-AMP synthase [Alphaproteobacteria bacterium]|nr:threonylcarbamoyl-AMP synthase [Alphaproteobacteria bacterium]
MPRFLSPSETNLNAAGESLRRGELVAFPTETVYGLGGNALDGQAVAKIFAAKGRPSFNPLIVHYAGQEAVANDVELTDFARALAGHFWPGPLTFVLPRKKDCRISELASAGLPTLAVRVPAHPVAAALLRTARVPVAAPSANRSGTISPTTPAHVADSLGEHVSMVLAGGACSVGLESTVVDLSGEKPVILRPGAVTDEDILKATGRKVGYDLGNHDKPRSPGQLLRHYAPRARLRLNAVDLEPGEALLAFGGVRFVGIRGGGAASDLPEDRYRNLSETGDLIEAAAHLFSMLHALDAAGNERVAVMPVPDQGIGIAINDRLRRAAAS